jgi:histidine triad (HIT) family protein
VRQEDPDAREVYRDEHVVAFFPTEPATLGHTLVVPRDHIPDIWALDDETATHLAAVTMDVAHAIRAAVEPDGLNIIQSNGEAATQTVAHLHVHVVPRRHDDTMGPIWPAEPPDYSDREKDDVWNRIRARCEQIDSASTSEPVEQLDVVPDLNPDDHRKHLDFIQAIVTRMSAASSAAKGWMLPVVTATYGFAVVKDARSVALLGIAAVLVFAFLDANYLGQEKAFRRLYDKAVRNPNGVPRFSLNPADADESSSDDGYCKRVIQIVGRWVPPPSVWFSWSIAPFYGALLIVGLLAYGHAIPSVPTSTAPTPSSPSSSVPTTSSPSSSVPTTSSPTPTVPPTSP